MPLPPRGSAQDEILLLLHERQRELKFSEVALFAALLDPRPGLRDVLLKRYREELFEESYRPAILRERLAEVRKQVQAKVDQKRLLDKVGKLGGADAAPQKKSAGKKQVKAVRRK